MAVYDPSHPRRHHHTGKSEELRCGVVLLHRFVYVIRLRESSCAEPASVERVDKIIDAHIRSDFCRYDWGFQLHRVHFFLL